MTLTMQEEIAEFLLDIQAVKFRIEEPFFTWASGIKSPIYCDNRIINSKVEVREAVVNAFTNIIKNKFLEETDIIAGVATGGIPYGVLVADRLKLPFIYVRSERKKHGLEKQIEGAFKPGDKVILIEDHISTGGSSLNAIIALREEGMQLISLLSIMTYGFAEAKYRFGEAGVSSESLCDLDTVLNVAVQKNIIKTEDKYRILEFRKSPQEWIA
ncbi:MAG: orotate phosphoribosyltransferase [Ginsengibacter sp.]